MCNAWNHDPSCCCGFGGENNSSGTVVRERSELAYYESYVNPFAKCPRCRLPVFFFQAANGGRVFFDDLGHPWPKHPCTDRSLDHLPVEIDRLQGRVSAAVTPTWEKEGWSPFLLTGAYVPRGQLEYRVTGRMITPSQSLHASILMESTFFRRVSDWTNRWEPSAPTFVRRVGKICELTGITLTGGQVREHSLKGQSWF
jgi:hypothetical protein